jgi:hypothetical protein
MLQPVFMALSAVNDYLSIFITWVFVVPFLYNFACTINCRNKHVMHISLVMMLSYTLSLFMFKASFILTGSIYLDLVIADLLTIFTLACLSYNYKHANATAYYYLLFGLTFNATLHMAMHYDYVVLVSYDYWWLWGVYGVGQFSSDLIMALVLIINKDILGLVKLKRALFNRGESQAMVRK